MWSAQTKKPNLSYDGLVEAAVAVFLSGRLVRSVIRPSVVWLLRLPLIGEEAETWVSIAIVMAIGGSVQEWGWRQQVAEAGTAEEGVVASYGAGGYRRWSFR